MLGRSRGGIGFGVGVGIFKPELESESPEIRRVCSPGHNKLQYSIYVYHHITQNTMTELEHTNLNSTVLAAY